MKCSTIYKTHVNLVYINDIYLYEHIMVYKYNDLKYIGVR